ncbi:MAG: hypothetical protein PHD38_10705, partial [Mesotoga sp.]|nr:hypothetical protein [Mesotoga sp.]
DMIFIMDPSGTDQQKLFPILVSFWQLGTNIKMHTGLRIQLISNYSARTLRPFLRKYFADLFGFI